MADPIHNCIARWHDFVGGRAHDALDDLLHEDVEFYSPIVFTPQVGRDITKLYLAAAGGTLGGGNKSAEEKAADKESGGGFKYTKEIMSGNAAMLEFETEMDGKYVNGVDIITCNDDGVITEFRVMIRPLQAVNLVHAQMKAMLERLQS